MEYASSGILPHKSLVLDRITKRYGSVLAVSNVSLMLDDREFLAVVGPTGCGKTTLLRLIAGFERPSEGHIFIHGQCVDQLKPSRRGVRMVFQDNALWPHMRVFDKYSYSNLSFSLKIRNRHPREIGKRIDSISKRLGIGRKLYRRKPAQLSEGQKQMVGIGRAMTIKPVILLMDEPFSNIDPQQRLTLRRELKDYHDEMRATTVYVTHNLPEAFAVADRMAMMKEGKIIQIDTPSRIRKRPADQFVSDFIRCSEM